MPEQVVTACVFIFSFTNGGMFQYQTSVLKKNEIIDLSDDETYPFKNDFI